MISLATEVQSSTPSNSPNRGWVDGPNLIEQLVSDQKRLQTAAIHFSRWHEEHDPSDSPELESHYQKLIPLAQPKPGEQYAFEVDVEACSACKACVSACHSLNGLATHETWRDVGNVFGGEEWDPIVQTITSACHHCVEPGCLEGCPVLAYDKDETTGVVKHLDDQCIGCQYCVLKCPYDVPKYSEDKGIVRKCDMCHERLGAGEAPACVQACPNEAIRIVTVSQNELRIQTKDVDKSILPSTVTSSYTLPSTRYLGALQKQGASAADVNRLRLEPSHFPLVVMLVLTQLAAGCFAADAVSRFFLERSEVALLLVGVVAAGLGVNASVLHLGRPMKAWRAFLGWRKSWLSREIISFGMLVPMSVGVLALAVLDYFGYEPPVPVGLDNILKGMSMALVF
ncbi:MAG: DmsC/YnfH family molybdoenzyme membrane anchor subunit, partial [Verrucomicrobiota bacterium]